MSESQKQSPFTPTSTQLEIQRILAEMSRCEILESPADKGKYLSYGYLLQCGKIPSADGKLKKIATTDVVYLPIPNPGWLETEGEGRELTISPGSSFRQDLKITSAGELHLKLLSDLMPSPLIKIFLSEKEVDTKVTKFNSVLIVSFPLPKKETSLAILVQNNSDQEISFLGAGGGLKVRYAEPVPFGNRSLVRKVKRGMTLIKNGEFKALANAVYYNGVGKLHALKRSISVLVLAVAFSSCVLPPDAAGPRVYSKKEIDYITDFQKGIYYSQSGRFDQAELNLRTALDSTDQPPTILLSNLGFVLRAQDKFPDAIIYLNQALKSDPFFLHARVNLGRTYFEMGELDLALKEYLTAERDYFGHWKSTPDKRLTNDFNENDLLNVYTNLSIMYAQKGLLEEAICYSQKAVDLHNKNYKPQSHARFLLSLEEFFLAGETLRQVVFTGTQVTAPLPASLVTDAAAGTTSNTIPEEDSSSIQDLGVVRLLEDNLPLAAEAFDRVLTLTIVPEDERILTELLRYEVAQGQNDMETIELLNQSFAEISEGLCESDSYVTPTYWPVRLRDRILERRKLVCKKYG